MSASKKYSHYENYLLKGKLRRNGFERWRYVFTGLNRTTGDQRTFFIELYYINPLISPDKPVLAQKSRPKISESDLQYALAGTASAQSVSQEISVQPSYVLVKAGVYGVGGRQFNKFFPAKNLVFDKKEGAFKVDPFVFGNDALVGSIAVSPSEIQNKPELLCSSGMMDWNIHYEKNIECGPMRISKTNFWMPVGSRTVFAGLVHIDGQEYSIIPRSSSGYIDRAWGSCLPNPLFHLSSANLTSAISGKPLLHSCFAVEGEFDNELSIYVNVEGRNIVLNGKSFLNKYTEIHNWSQMPADADGEKLHWTVSVHKRRLVVDMDIYCKTSEMFVRDYETPEGQRQLLKVLGGGTGFGEIRVYRKVGHNLELLEHANVNDAVCEYGSIDKIEE